MSLVLVLVTLGVGLCPSTSLASSTQDLLRLEQEEAASRWAPLVWLHPAENFFPSSVPYFLRHITVRTEEGRAPAQQEAGAAELTLPGGRPSREFFLMAEHNFECHGCTLPGFLRGEKPRKKYSPPVYVTVHECSSQPSGRATRSTKNPLPGVGGMTNHRVSAEKERGSTPTSFSSTGFTSTSSFISSSLPPTLSSLSSNQGHTQPSTPNSSTRSQTRPAQPLLSTPEPTNHSSVSYDGNVTSTSHSSCTDGSSLCRSGHSESMAPLNEANNETDKYEGNLYTDATELTESTPLEITEMPGTEKSHKKRNNTTSFLHPSITSMPPNSTDVDDTDAMNNRSQGQRHNNTRRHARLVDQRLPYEQVYTLTYWMFYPYNRGKKVCTVNLGAFLGHFFKLRVNGLCHGEELTMGNHVGDWEHVSINFKGNRPRRMYVSSHTFGAFYTYEPQSHTFVYESEDTREGISMSPVYPRTIQLTGSHPILYSARGSHGVWGSEGVHEYNSLPRLVDETGRGTPWKTWTNMKLVNEKDSASVQPHRNWWRYEGRWGNPSSSCHVLLGGFCEHVKGPTGIPRKRINFPCRRP